MQSKNLYICILTVFCTLIWAGIYISASYLFNNFRPASFVTALLFYPMLMFMIISYQHNKKIIIDKTAVLFWLLFMVGYIVIVRYLQAVPSLLGISIGFLVYVLLQVVTTKYKRN